MNIVLVAFLTALGFGLVSGIAGTFALTTGKKRSLATGAHVGLASGVVIFFFNWLILYTVRPVMLAPSIWPYLLLDLLIVAVIGLIAVGIEYVQDDGQDGWDEARWNVAFIAGSVAFLVVLMGGWYEQNQDVTDTPSAKRAADLVHVTVEDQTAIPDTDNNLMVIVSDEVATSRANQAMSSGAPGLNTYFNVGPATKEYVNGRVWYVFQLVYDGAGNKKKVADRMVPGYIMVDALDPDASVVQHFGKDPDTGVDYRLKYSLGGGQDESVERYVYTHGYASYQLDDPTLEIMDNGKPMITITLRRPVMNWGYQVPVGMITVDPLNGTITRYSLDPASKNPVPDWVDRVYSQQDVVNMTGWWGLYGDPNADYHFGAGRTNANRYKIPNQKDKDGKDTDDIYPPQLVYTKGGHPTWQTFLTSFNADTSVYEMFYFDARTNQARAYKPAQGKTMGTEDTITHVFESIPEVKASGYKVADLTLHRIYGRLTWVASYMSQNGANASFVGVGFLDAYDATIANVQFGKTKQEALNKYQNWIATSHNNNGPEEGGDAKPVTGTVVDVQKVDEGGQTWVYLKLAGDPHLYRGAAGMGNLELIYVKPGAKVSIVCLNLNDDVKVRQIRAFDDLGQDLDSAPTK